jgi:hypothetical protein
MLKKKEICIDQDIRWFVEMTPSAAAGGTVIADDGGAAWLHTMTHNIFGKNHFRTGPHTVILLTTAMTIDGPRSTVAVNNSWRAQQTRGSGTGGGGWWGRSRATCGCGGGQRRSADATREEAAAAGEGPMRKRKLCVMCPLTYFTLGEASAPIRCKTGVSHLLSYLRSHQKKKHTSQHLGWDTKCQKND